VADCAATLCPASDPIVAQPDRNTTTEKTARHLRRAFCVELSAVSLELSAIGLRSGAIGLNTLNLSRNNNDCSNQLARIAL
jgi:hypothetical protein